MRLLKRGRREETHSRVLADLLNLRGTHALGSAFLEAESQTSFAGRDWIGRPQQSTYDLAIEHGFVRQCIEHCNDLPTRRY